MNINSYYSIVTYYGEDLNLLNAPAKTLTQNNITIDNPEYLKYRKIIDNIQTIYATEQSDKKIPAFWTTTSGTSYIPSVKSTLTYLEKDKSYYFLLRPEAVLPITGLELEPIVNEPCSFIDSNCCPKILLDVNDNNEEDLELVETNHAYLSIVLDNLIPGNSYIYNIKSLDSNWPCFVKPSGGLYRAFAPTGVIKSVFRFGSSENDNNNSLSYTLQDDADKNNKYNILSVNITPTGGIYSSTSNPCSTVSEQITLRCNNCIPSDSGRYPIVSFADSPKLILNSSCCSADQPLRINVSNVYPGKEYNYRLESYTDNVTFIPSTGIVSFGYSGSGKFQTLINVNNNALSLIKVTIIDTITNDSFTDFLPITCGSCFNEI